MDIDPLTTLEQSFEGDLQVDSNSVVYLSEPNGNPAYDCDVKKFSFYPRVLNKAEIREYVEFHSMAYSRWNPSWRSSTGSLSLTFQAKASPAVQHMPTLSVGLYCGTSDPPPDISKEQLLLSANAAYSSLRMYQVEIEGSGNMTIRYAPHFQGDSQQSRLYRLRCFSK